MAAAGLLALLDDIATLLDDVALLSKVAAKKTAGVLGDDLALNAEQVSGVRAERELPVVWAVFKGSAINKVVLVPVALLLSAFLPQVITPLLMIGGAFLCYEGFEKVAHKFLHASDSKSEADQLQSAIHNPDINLAEFEKAKIKGAIRTDFILSAEIVVIALGAVQSADMVTQATTLAIVAALITIGVYGVVAGIVKLDDAGLYLMRLPGDTVVARGKRLFGRFLLRSCPWLMKALSILGTVAMFLVGGGILLHGAPVVHEFLHHGLAALLPHSAILESLMGPLLGAVAGLVAGAVLVSVMTLVGKLRR
ncbi:DUF808 domain-containing protein [Pseudomaricurvus sp. HS19]|uniref:DUF808 domain-containing protein n=1 Tax=Pseudomaricurvus sp. HS19 TaxID=2692626 RepID=UPI00136E3738|nr:DUF808 domain-containing protein [Pseudomaricurvus sp. HS19]MYM64235.1 DUF808 family protein [Pseudomaricurvus sp. HS19]